MNAEVKISEAQQKILDVIKEHQPVKFIMWGVNYFRMMDVNNNWVKGGKIMHVTYDALLRKGLIEKSENGYILTN